MNEPAVLVVGVTQTIFANDELNKLGIYGNCMQAAVASLMNLPLEAVPHFGAFDDWPAAMALWARGRGLLMKGERTNVIPERRCLVGGDSPRGFKHMVVGGNGRVLWDPHPSRDGLVKVTEATWFEPAAIGSPEGSET
jgi:hypothetical protein